MEAIINPTIIHYTGGEKPWYFSNTHPFKNNYWHYVRLTAFNGPRAMLNKINPAAYLRVKLLLLKYMPKWLNFFLKKLYVGVIR